MDAQGFFGSGEKYVKHLKNSGVWISPKKCFNICNIFRRSIKTVFTEFLREHFYEFHYPNYKIGNIENLN